MEFGYWFFCLSRAGGNPKVIIMFLATHINLSFLYLNFAEYDIDSRLRGKDRRTEVLASPDSSGTEVERIAGADFLK